MITNSIQLVNTKIRVNSPEESERIQRRAFDIGFFWNNQTSIPRYTDSKFLYFADVNIYHGNDMEWFNVDLIDFEEITLYDIFGDEPPEEYGTSDTTDFKIINTNNEIIRIYSAYEQLPSEEKRKIAIQMIEWGAQQLLKTKQP